MQIRNLEGARIFLAPTDDVDFSGEPKSAGSQRAGWLPIDA